MIDFDLSDKDVLFTVDTRGDFCETESTDELLQIRRKREERNVCEDWLVYLVV